MPDPETPPKPHRRPTRVVLGSLATGAMLGAAAAITGGLPVAGTPSSIHEQFDGAFTPGAVDLDGSGGGGGGGAIVVDVG